MSNPFGLKQTLAWLESFRAILNEFARREQALAKQEETELARARQRHTQQRRDFQIQNESRREQTQQTFAGARNLAQEKLARRTNRLGQAHKNSLRQAAQNAENREGGRKHKLQTEVLRNQRTHARSRQEAEETFEKFREELTNENAALSALEERARSTCSRYVRNASENLPVQEAKDEFALMEDLRLWRHEADEDLRKWSRLLLPRLFRYTPLWLVLIAAQFALVPVLQRDNFTYTHAGAVGGALLGLGVVLYFVGRGKLRHRAARILNALAAARQAHDLCWHKSERRHADALAAADQFFEETSARINLEWQQALDEGQAAREAAPADCDRRLQRALQTNERVYRLKLEKIGVAELTASQQLENAATTLHELESAARAEENQIQETARGRWAELLNQWEAAIQPLEKQYKTLVDHAAARFGSWEAEHWHRWSPPAAFSQTAKIGDWILDFKKLAEVPMAVTRLPHLETHRRLPIFLAFPHEGSLTLETQTWDGAAVAGALNNVILRLLCEAPAGRLAFTLIDPIGLGQNFSGILHLADQAEHLIHSKVWTQPAHIDERLTELTEHIEKVIQMYLRNEYATIAEYNEKAGTIAEKYQFLVITDFPAQFSESALRKLTSILANGPRCGVFTLVHWNKKLPQPTDFSTDLLRQNGIWLQENHGRFLVAGKIRPGAQLELEAPPPPALLTELVQKVGQASKDSNRVELPFSQIAPMENEFWSLETTQELRVAIGRTGATKLQHLVLGKDTRQHALVSGQTGSGKSTLFHVIVTNLAAWSSPDEIQFYLIDFKKGVEFKSYATHRLPHARVIGIESDREFGVSVLQRLDEELKKRGELFRKLGVQDLPGYKRASGEKMPRVLLLIDEFQEFFVEDDKVAQTASLLLDRIVRQGRAFGIHAILGSQTLGGAYSMARATLGQMAVRVALQCNEADAYLIMDDNNPAPRLLSRPGEGIYNDTAGTIEGNSPFQVVWLSDAERDAVLRRARELADRSGKGYPAPIVFEGNLPANVEENSQLEEWRKARPTVSANPPRIWVGAANSIKGPTEVVFQRQSGNNLLVVGQKEEAVLAIFSIGLLGLAVQHVPRSVQLIVADAAPVDSPSSILLRQVSEVVDQPVTVARSGDVSGVIADLVDELKTRTEAENALPAGPIFLLIHGLHRFHRLRYEEDFSFGSENATPNPAAQLNQLITEGPRVGIHVVVWCDTFNNVNRFLSRKALSEFELRILFQMSPNDSASLIDNAKAANLGLNRGLFFNQQEGHTEIFRPYVPPTPEWVASWRPL